MRAVSPWSSFLLVLLSATLTAHAQTLEQLRTHLYTTAIDTTLDQPGTEPYHLKLAIQLHPILGKAESGTVEEWWSGTRYYRVVYDFPSYQATFVRDGENHYTTAGAGPIPYAAQVLLEQFLRPMLPTSQLEDSVPVLERKRFDKVQMDCLHVTYPRSHDSAPSTEVRTLRPPNVTYCLASTEPKLYITIDPYFQIVRVRTGTFRSTSVPLDLNLISNDVIRASARVEALEGRPSPYPVPHDGLIERTEAPATTPGTNGLQLGHIVSTVDPIYPEGAEMKHISGTVALDAIVGSNGAIQQLTAIASPDDQLAQAAIDAVRQWRYSPSLLNGKPIPVELVIAVNFVHH